MLRTNNMSYPIVCLELNIDRKKMSHTWLHTINKDTSTFTAHTDSHHRPHMDTLVFVSEDGSEAACDGVSILSTDPNNIQE